MLVTIVSFNTSLKFNKRLLIEFAAYECYELKQYIV